MCRNFSAESELKLFGCGGSPCNLHWCCTCFPAPGLTYCTHQRWRNSWMTKGERWTPPLEAFLGEADTAALRDPPSQWEAMPLISRLWGEGSGDEGRRGQTRNCMNLPLLLVCPIEWIFGPSGTLVIRLMTLTGKRMLWCISSRVITYLSHDILTKRKKKDK